MSGAPARTHVHALYAAAAAALAVATLYLWLVAVPAAAAAHPQFSPCWARAVYKIANALGVWQVFTNLSAL